MGFFNKNKNKREPDGNATGILIRRCAAIYAGRPEWDGVDGVHTVNFARTVCAETARLAVLGTRISVSGGRRADWMRARLDRVSTRLRQTVELACAYGTVILKPNGVDVDVVTPDRFSVVEHDGGDIRAAVFRDSRRGADGHSYERHEFHRSVGGVYVVSNRCTRDGDPVPLDASPWRGLAPDVRFSGVSRPLFGVLRMPSANNLDPSSPLGLPVFSDAISELRDLDIAVSRASREIEDSRRTVLIDSDRLLPYGRRGSQRTPVLPDFVRAVAGTGVGDLYHEINPTLNTSERVAGINAILFGIGVKCVFTSGYFTSHGRSGVMTATEVEANDRRTVEHIRDIRDMLERAIREAADALGAFCDIYAAAPNDGCEIALDFGDITYNREEDRRRWYEYVRDGRVSFEYFLRRFEGETAADAAAIARGGEAN